jgi:hypothetical protein
VGSPVRFQPRVWQALLSLLLLAGCLILFPWLGAWASSCCLSVRLPACSNPCSPTGLATCHWQCRSLPLFPLSMYVPYTARTPTDLIPTTPSTPTHPPAAPQAWTA